MHIVDAQRENRFRFSGGFYGQAISGLMWLVSACVASWGTPKSAILLLVTAGFFIFPITEILVRTVGTRAKLSSGNSLPQLGMQVAFLLPFSMLLLLPVSQFNVNLFYPALMILLGAHYLPFIFLYGMRMFDALLPYLGAPIAECKLHNLPTQRLGKFLIKVRHRVEPRSGILVSRQVR
jgi:hypothetical protein